MKLKKVVIIVTVFLLFLNTICFADVNTGNFKPPKLTDSDYGTAFEMTGTIVNVLEVVGVIIAITGIMILGIKYMMGSVEQKAEYKKTMIPYLVGCVFVFAIPKIVSIIYSIVSKI